MRLLTAAIHPKGLLLGGDEGVVLVTEGSRSKFMKPPKVN